MRASQPKGRSTRPQAEAFERSRGTSTAQAYAVRSASSITHRGWARSSMLVGSAPPNGPLAQLHRGAQRRIDRNLCPAMGTGRARNVT